MSGSAVRCRIIKRTTRVYHSLSLLHFQTQRYRSRSSLSRTPYARSRCHKITTATPIAGIHIEKQGRKNDALLLTTQKPTYCICKIIVWVLRGARGVVVT
jgi:hypothetical protein